MIRPRGGLSPDGTRWVACRPGSSSHRAGLSSTVPALFSGNGLRDLPPGWSQLAFLQRSGRIWPTGHTFQPLGSPPFRNSEMGGLCQTALGRAGGGTGNISAAKHTGCDLRTPRLVQPQMPRPSPSAGRITQSIWRPAEGHAPGPRPSPSRRFLSCLAGRVPASGITRCCQHEPASQHHQNRARLLCVQQSNSPAVPENHKPRSHHSPCANQCSLRCGAQCASSKSSARAKKPVITTTARRQPHDKIACHSSRKTHQLNPQTLVRNTCACSLPASPRSQAMTTETHSLWHPQPCMRA